MSTSRDGSSLSDEAQRKRIRDFESLLGRTDARITCQELRELLSGKNGKERAGSQGILLDVREEWEYRFVRFPEAIHIPLSRLPANLDSIPKDRQVIVYCHTGIRSLLACYLLIQNGFPNVRNLEGGIDEFARVLGPAIPRYRLEEGRRPPSAVLAENVRGEGRRLHNPWGEGVSGRIFL